MWEGVDDVMPSCFKCVVTILHLEPVQADSFSRGYKECSTCPCVPSATIFHSTHLMSCRVLKPLAPFSFSSAFAQLQETSQAV